MRPISNLTQLSEYKLDARKQRSGFIGLYEGRVGSKNALIDIYWSLVACALVPAFRQTEVKTDSLKNTVETLRDADHKRTVRTVLRKNLAARRLELRAPLATFITNSFKTVLTPTGWMASFRGQPDLMDSYQSISGLDTTPLANGATITGAEAAATFALSARARELVSKAVLSIDATQDSNGMTVWCTFGIDAEEAEYLTNSSFAELRLSDIYPTLMDWVAQMFGRFKKAPRSITKVSAIAEGVRQLTAEKPAVPRIGLSGLVADIKGDYYYIPEIDQSSEYEEKLLAYGLRDDGSYTWHQPRAELDSGDAPEGRRSMNLDDEVTDVVPKRKLPKNMPIFSDWLNDKFSYSNTAGNLAVYDLSDTVPCANYHIQYLLGSKMTSVFDESKKVGHNLRVFMNAACAMDPSILQILPQEDDAPSGSIRDCFRQAIDAPHLRTPSNGGSMLDYAHRLFDTQARIQGAQGDDRDNIFLLEDLRLADLCSDKTIVPAFKFMSRAIEKAAQVINANVEVLYQKMQVMNALQMIAYARIMITYGSEYDEVVRDDLDQRNVYLTQGVDETYVQQGAPFIKKDLNFQPHQAKVDNIMRRSPTFAAYDVDAGGGKTILIMTNIFNEMKRGYCKRPLVCCPPTLVSQYVEEVVFVAEGRVNVIPITNATMRMHGEERLKMMLDRAPVNTIVVTDYDFVKGRSKQISYGNKSMNLFVNAEWLRQFEFDLIAVDESHKLSNLASGRREAMARLMQDIPMKRLASGTFVNNTITDLVSQVALFDPTIFHSKENFHDQYAANSSGDKVSAWKPGAEKAIRNKIKEHVVFASARRKEWAALLPQKNEQFDAVELTDNQRLLYESILEETTELIREAMEKDADLKESLESEDESVVDDLESMLRPYLVRLERFLSAPEEDEASDKFLKDPEDRVSPKVHKIYEIIREHFDKGIPGKILIFTNYQASAKSVFDNAPPDLKSQMLHYTAGKKMECRAQFARNDKLRIMVGVSSSMDTGINFQQVSRLIRMETVWTPGLVEQGNSRINRPQLKKREERQAIYFNWLMVNRTIDVTKIARLTAKIVSKAKFDEADTPEYQAIQSLPVISMNLDNIASKNDFNEELRHYLDVYQEYQRVEHQDFKKFRIQAEEEGKADAVPVKAAGLLKDSKLMSRVPYVPGMTIYGTDQLGLVRYDEFVHKDLTDLETEDGKSDDGGGKDPDDDPNNPEAAEIRRQKEGWAKELDLVNGMPCHTEFGDGVIYGVRRKVWVRFNADNSVMRVPKLQVFVITRTTTNSKDIRTELLKAAGDLPLDAPIEVPVEQGTQTLKRRAAQAEEAPVVNKNAVGASFSFAVINDMLAITMDATDNPKAAAAVQNFGFKRSPDYWFTKIRGPVLMLKLFKTLAAKGFKLDKKCSAELKEVYEDMRHGGRERMNMPGFATQLQIRDFTREMIKPSADPFEIKVFPRVDDGQLFLFMPKKGIAGNARAMKVPSEGVKWISYGGDAEYIRYVKNKAEAQKVLGEIKHSGITILNEKNLAQEFNAIKMSGK